MILQLQLFIKKIINDLSIDLCNGGVSDKLYNYYLKYDSNITSENFYKIHHQIIDYLLRLLKNEIKERLQANSSISN